MHVSVLGIFRKSLFYYRTRALAAMKIQAIVTDDIHACIFKQVPRISIHHVRIERTYKVNFDRSTISQRYLQEPCVKRSHRYSLRRPHRQNRLNSAPRRPPGRNRLQPHCGNARNCCASVYAYVPHTQARTASPLGLFFFSFSLHVVRSLVLNAADVCFSIDALRHRAFHNI